MNAKKIVLVFVVACLFLQEGGVNSQCPRRSEASALCRKPCQTDKDCVTRKNRPRACVCDGTCGLSCARMNMQCVETPPDEPVNGERKFNGRTVTIATVFSVNDVINYSCKKGYTLRGPSELRCSAIGKFKPWDKGTPTCQRSCPDPGVPANGRRNGDSFKAGKTVTFRCNPGYNLIGLNSLTCTNSLTWDGSAPKCDVALCGQPVIPVNARIEKGFRQQYIYGDRVLFVCNAGYYRSGFGQIVCGQKSWSDMKFKCLAKSCGNPGSPKNGKREGNSFKFLQVVTYSCDVGFELVGAAFQRCQADQTWDGTLPTCERLDCGEPDPLATGRYFGSSTLYGSSYTITCNDGYEPDGPAKITCNAKGEWSSKTSCQMVRCKQIDIVNGEAKGLIGLTPCTTLYNCKLTFSCDNGYYLTEINKELLCLQSGLWNGKPPTCLAVSCGMPVIPNNAVSRGTKTTFKSKITFECNPGFNLIGSKTITCEANRRWSTRTPSCKAKDCGPPPLLSYGYVLRGYKTIYPESASYRCITGYVLKGTDKQSCQSNGKWSDSNQYCEAIKCTQPDSIAYGSVRVSGFSYLDIATYYCINGYKLEGQFQRTCNEILKPGWSGSEPRCKAIECGSPKQPMNGYTRGNRYSYGDVIKYVCNSGYRLDVSSSTSQCQANGLWSNAKAKCEAEDCGSPPSLSDGYILPGYKTVYPEFVFYKCNTGYVLMGTDKQSCLSNGKWSNSYQYCQAIKCSVPNSIANGYVRATGLRYLDNVTYTCDLGYKLNGQSQRTCQEIGWSDAEPRCEAIDCGRPREPMNGKLVGNQYSYGDVVKYECNVGYQLNVGSSSSRCQSNGLWSSSPPKCEPVSCPPPPSIYNGRPLKYSTLTYKSKVWYKCDIGYEFVAENQTTCRGNGKWSSIPMCQDIYCKTPDVSEYSVTMGRSTRYRYGNVIKVKCTGSRKMIGSSYIRCGSDGKWDVSNAICQTIVSCGVPNTSKYVIINGQSNSYHYGDVIDVKCTRNRKVIGRSYIQCGSDGKWNESEAICQNVCSEPLGLESRQLKDRNIKASAHYINREAWFARLNSATSWCGYFLNRGDLYADISLGRTVNLTRVAIQGGRDAFNAEVWPTEIQIYTQNGLKWTTYKDYPITANSADDITSSSFGNGVVANRVIIFIRKSSNGGLFSCARFELYGCTLT